MGLIHDECPCVEIVMGARGEGKSRIHDKHMTHARGSGGGVRLLVKCWDGIWMGARCVGSGWRTPPSRVRGSIKGNRKLDNSGNAECNVAGQRS